MGRQIIETSPNVFAIYSSISDDFIGYNATKEEIIEFYREEAADKAERDILETFEKLENGIKPYYQFTQSLDEMLDWIKEQHGEEVYETRKKELGLS